MKKLNKSRYGAVFEMYRESDAFFPLIGAVLLDRQDGVVYVDDPISPREVYVEHAFGFAQIFGVFNSEFESKLEQYLLVDKRFVAPKVRLYTPYLPNFLHNSKYNTSKSIRQRFLLDPKKLSSNKKNNTKLTVDMKLVKVDEGNVADVEQVFGVVSRFWRSPDDFISKANAVFVSFHDQPASICYSAAQANGCVEIDVITLSKYRMKGIGKIIVTHFAQKCLEQSLQPLWDCFTNNAGSMQLCLSVGFVASRPPYPFFTIGR